MAFDKCVTCGNKGTFQDGTPGCIKFKIPVNLQKDGCSWHIDMNNLYRCKICGAAETSLLVFDYNQEYHYICEPCFKKLDTCATCSHTNCTLEQDNSMPTYVFQTIQQGMMTMQTQVKNPELVKKHCPSCKCMVKNDNPKGAPYLCGKEVSNGSTCKSWELNSQFL